jgi:hypothetical protein
MCTRTATLKRCAGSSRGWPTTMGCRLSGCGSTSALGHRQTIDYLRLVGGYTDEMREYVV